MALTGGRRETRAAQRSGRSLGGSAAGREISGEERGRTGEEVCSKHVAGQGLCELSALYLK